MTSTEGPFDMKRMTIAARVHWSVSIAATLVLLFCAIAAPAETQPGAYPARQLQIIVPFPAGGSADFFARTVFNKLAPLIGHPIVIENKAGASGIVGAKAVINAAPDGYTLLVSAVASVIIPPSLTDPPAFDPLKDLTPITGIGTVPAVLVVTPSLGIKTFAELLDYAKANPGKLNLASSGTGTISHLTAELLMRETGIKVQHVPYRGAPPAVTDLLGGHADLMFSDAPFFLEHIRAGKLVPLAVGTAHRAPSLPNVPTTAELGYPAVVASNTYSLFAPPKTPPEVVEKLDQLVLTVLRDPEIRESFAKQEASPAGETPDRFRSMLQAESDRWIPIVRAAGVRAN
jgi:tripartite-type tricarboxylate transporter receptor subunit TctC